MVAPVNTEASIPRKLVFSMEKVRKVHPANHILTHSSLFFCLIVMCLFLDIRIARICLQEDDSPEIQ